MEIFDRLGGVPGEVPSPRISDGLTPERLPPKVEETAEALLTHPVAFVERYNDEVARLLRAIPEGMYTASELTKLFRESMDLPPEEQHYVLTSLLAHPRLTLLEYNQRPPSVYVGVNDPEKHFDSMLGRVERLVDHFWRSSYQTNHHSVKFSRCFQIAHVLGLQPTDRRQKEQFQELFKGHPQTRVRNKELRGIRSADESGPPATAGGVLSRIAASPDLSHTMSVERWASRVCGGRVLADDALQAIRILMGKDGRFEAVFAPGIQEPHYKVLREPRVHPAAQPPAELSVDQGEQQIAALAKLGHAALDRLLDGNQRTLSRQYLLRVMEEMRGQPLADFERAYLLRDNDWLVDPRPEHHPHLYMVKDLFGDGAFLGISAQRKPVSITKGHAIDKALTGGDAFMALQNIERLLAEYQSWLDSSLDERP